MGVGEIDLPDDGKASPISCSVCLDHVIDNGDRSWAKLQCGHQFHLDCIGSAFNIKGVMQCPNCRKIEKGQWLFAAASNTAASAASRSFPDINMMDDWVHDEDLYDLSYSEMAFGLHWCPFNGLTTRLPSSFDESDYASAAYHDLLGQHAIYEPPATSSASHPCPYIAYVGPVHPSSSSSNASIQDGGPSFNNNNNNNSNNNHWNGASSGPSEVAASYAAAYPAMEVHYHTWEQNSMPNFSSGIRGGGSSGDQAAVPLVSHRQARPNSDASRSGNFMHHFPAGHSSVARTGTSLTSSLNPPHPGSVARTRDRVQALQAYFQQPTNSHPVRTPVNSRRSNHRGYPQAGPASSSSDQSGGYYYFPSASSNGRNSLETESHLLSNHYNPWDREHHNFLSLSQMDRDPIWGPLPRPRRGTDRMQSQNR